VCGHQFADRKLYSDPPKQSRGSDFSPWFCHKVSEYGYGVAILNESKYGYATAGNVMTLSLLRAPTMPDADADQGEHAFAFAIYPHVGNFEESDVFEVAEAFNSPLRGACWIRGET
jgi:alpha-mannosidase